MAKYWSSMPQMVLCSQAQGLRSAKQKVMLGALVGILGYLIADNAYAADISTVMNNLRKIINPLTGLLLMISFVAGIFFLFKGILLLKKFGGGAGQQFEFTGPLTYLLVGAVLVYLPTSTDVMLNSLFGGGTSLFGGSTPNFQQLGKGSSLLGYSAGGNLQQQWQTIADTLVLYIQFLGFLSFLKGWFMITKIANHGSQQGGLAKGLTHIIGGIIAINFVGIVHIVQNTLTGS